MTESRRKRLEPAFACKGDYYNYTPCLLQEGEARTRHVFYCANRTPGERKEPI